MNHGVELFVYGTCLPHCCYDVHAFNKCVFVKHSDILTYFLVILIFYCANTTAFFIFLTGKFWKGSIGFKSNCKMGRCLKKDENQGLD